METVEGILRDKFPSILDSELVKAIEQHAVCKTVDDGDLLMDIGTKISTIPMMASGSVKVFREDDLGNELFLYYLNAGETCAMSLTCCMAFKRSEIRAVAQEKVTMLAIPVEYMDEWMVYRDWRSFVMNTYRLRFEELLETVDSIAFLNLDERLVKYLEQKAMAMNSKTLLMSHQDVAIDLNSSREVISRILKKMETGGKVKLGRNKIELLV